MSIDVIATPRRPRTTVAALNLLNEDMRRSPGPTLRARRDKMNRQREARMERDAAAAEQAARDDFDSKLADRYE
jgi:hypothetical protein